MPAIWYTIYDFECDKCGNCKRLSDDVDKIDNMDDAIKIMRLKKWSLLIQDIMIVKCLCPKCKE